MPEIDIRRPVNPGWAKGEYGPIKRNQVWFKRDTGKEMFIYGPGRNNTWVCYFPTGGRNGKAHHIKVRDIYRFYYQK